MHSQAELIQHLTAVRSALVSRHRLVESGVVGSEGCICLSSDAEVRNDAGHPMHTAVKQLVAAEFVRLGVEYDGTTYMYPIRVSTSHSSASNYVGTVEQVAEGYAKRLALIDKWIADANKKLLAAVFRKALDKVSKAGLGQYMCNNIKTAAAELVDVPYGQGYAAELAEEALEILEQYRPFEHTSSVWFNTDERGRGIRMAILNLCITEVTRGFK